MNSRSFLYKVSGAFILIGLLATPLLAQSAVNPRGEGKQAPASNEAQVYYATPSGWQVTPVQGSRFKIATGPPNNGFVPNISISEAEYPGSLAQFMEDNVKMMRMKPELYKIVSQGSFSAKSGLKGIKLVFDMTQNNRSFRNTQYIFDPGQSRAFLLVNCTTTTETSEIYSSVFDRSMSTFSVK